MESVLHRASPADVADEPFPHLVVSDALDGGLYAELARQFPPASLLIDGRQPASNTYYHYGAGRILENAAVSPLWREFVARHVAPEFYREVMSLFGDRARSLHPGLETRLGRPLEALETSVRRLAEPRDVALECQLTYCSPPDRPSSSAPPHVDREVALYAGLLYFRCTGDDSAGGDLDLYRFRGEPCGFRADRSVPESLLEKVSTVGYHPNTLVFFLHSPRAVHGVSPRAITPYPRLHVNFVGELRDKVFDLGPCRAAGEVR
jgi:hypothetical protein